MMRDVPIIDLAPYFSGSPEGKATVARRVAEACEGIGFLKITGHGVPQALIDQAFAVATRFFDQPEAEKSRSRPSASSSARGYHALLTKNLAKTIGQNNPPDLREQFYIGPLTSRGAEFAQIPGAADLYADNIWPETPADYKAVFSAYYSAKESLGQSLMRIFAIALALPETYFDDKINRHFSTLPANHYPAPEGDALANQIRAGEHTDFGSLTILGLNDAPGGLQVKTREGNWIDCTAERGEFIVNIGDMMQRWTNDRWLSNLHRVVNPPTDRRAQSRRMSIGYFLHPNYDAEIACIASCCSPDNPPRHAPVRAGDMMRKKLEARAA